jgi:hypothetical protein
MPTFRGNLGNLLQHWVLCELLAAAAPQVRHIQFIDAYSMAPLAGERHPKPGYSSGVFDSVGDSLPGQSSLYERTWADLGGNRERYPNSASFFTRIWPHSFSLLLCETDPRTVIELSRWAGATEADAHCTGVEVFPRDWRIRLRAGIPDAVDLQFFSFDPNMFNRFTPVNSQSAIMYTEDITLLGRAIEHHDQPVLVQLSTYSANNNNEQQSVRETLDAAASAIGLHRIACVVGDGHMMSMVYGRNIEWEADLYRLTPRFNEWLAKSKGNGMARS